MYVVYIMCECDAYTLSLFCPVPPVGSPISPTSCVSPGSVPSHMSSGTWNGNGFSK